MPEPREDETKSGDFMKKFISFLLIAAFFLFSCGGGGTQESTTLEPGTREYKLAKKLSQKIPKLDPEKNNVLATTKYFELTTGDVVSEWYSLAGDRIQQLAKFDSSRIVSILSNAVTQIATSKILSKKADEKGINIDSKRIDSILQQQYRRAGGKQKFQQRLTQRGITEKALRHNITQNIKGDTFLNSEIKSDYQPSQKKIQQVYENQYKNQEQISARHILIKAKDSTQKGKGLQKLREIKKKIENSADFAEMAKEYSEGPSSS